MSLPSKLLLPKSAGKIEAKEISYATATAQELFGNAPKIDPSKLVAGVLTQEALEEGGLVSGSFEYAGEVNVQLPKKGGGLKDLILGGEPSPDTEGPITKAYNELTAQNAITQEAIHQVEAASQDLHDIIGKASPKKPSKPQSLMALLSKKATPSN